MDLLRKIWKIIPYKLRLFLVRTFQDKFTVSVVALVEDSKGRVLVLDHFIRPGSSWGLPGGFIEPDEVPEEAVERELEEETGLRITDVRLMGVRTIRRHVEILFRARAEGEPVVGSREIRSAAWFSVDELPEGMNEHQRALVRRITAGTGGGQDELSRL